MGAEVPFDNGIIANFMACQDRLEPNLLELFAYPECFSVISVIIF